MENANRFGLTQFGWFLGLISELNSIRQEDSAVRASHTIHFLVPNIQHKQSNIERAILCFLSYVAWYDIGKRGQAWDAGAIQEYRKEKIFNAVNVISAI